jgi:menaquinol-cytochrome c reductase iron-sulfur subunit
MPFYASVAGGGEAYAPGALSEADVSRRRFLQTAVGALTAFIGLVAGIPLIGGLVGGIYRPKEAEWVKIADLKSIPVGQTANPTFPMQNVQAYVRETVLRKVWVVRKSPTEVTVFSPICPHLGCHFNWNAQKGNFECPCHESVYSFDGRVLAGPAPRPLDTLPWKIERGELFVQWKEFRVGIPERIPV